MPVNRASPPGRRRILSFRVLLALAVGAVVAELALIWLVPYLTTRYRQQLERADSILNDPQVFLREHEALRMIPPAIGMKYRRQVAAGVSPESHALFTKLLGLDPAARLELLQQQKVDELIFLGVLDHCYDGGGAESALEEHLVRAVAKGQLPYDWQAIWVKLSLNYYRPAVRSQYAGFVDDARRLYRRFVDLVRILNTDSAGGIRVQRALSRASVRLKVLAPEHVFATAAIRTIQAGSAAEMKSLVTHPDARLAGLARFNAASVLWHAHDEHEEAIRLLEADPSACAPLAVECKFLRAKILDSIADRGRLAEGGAPMSAAATAVARKARSLLDELARELPVGDPLLDDVYFHRALVAESRDDVASARAELRDLLRCCPNTDLMGAVLSLDERLPGEPLVRKPHR